MIKFAFNLRDSRVSSENKRVRKLLGNTYLYRWNNGICKKQMVGRQFIFIIKVLEEKEVL